MGSGLSMTSVNKIKELVAAREYSLALDIIDSQDLSRSLNPQFLRLCGEVHVHMGRYIDARKTFLMAHKLAPEAKRIMADLIDLYYRVGYFELAQTYYDLYMFDADEQSMETRKLVYIRAKANGEDIAALEQLLGRSYVDNLDYDWSFEQFLLYVKQNKTEEAKMLYRDYNAAYKKSEYSVIMSCMLEDTVKPDKYFNVYAGEIKEDDSDEESEIREEERHLLEADELRIHPKEPEITIMVDDYEESTIGSKHRFKKYMKEQEKLEKKRAEEDNASNVNKAEDEAPAENTENTQNTENTENTKEALDENTTEASTENTTTASDENTTEALAENTTTASSETEIEDEKSSGKIDKEDNEESNNKETSNKEARLDFLKKFFGKGKKQSNSSDVEELEPQSIEPQSIQTKEDNETKIDEKAETNEASVETDLNEISKDDSLKDDSKDNSYEDTLSKGLEDIDELLNLDVSLESGLYETEETESERKIAVSVDCDESFESEAEDVEELVDVCEAEQEELEVEQEELKVEQEKLEVEQENKLENKASGENLIQEAVVETAEEIVEETAEETAEEIAEEAAEETAEEIVEEAAEETAEEIAEEAVEETAEEIVEEAAEKTANDESQTFFVIEDVELMPEEDGDDEVDDFSELLDDEFEDVNANSLKYQAGDTVEVETEADVKVDVKVESVAEEADTEEIETETEIEEVEIEVDADTEKIEAEIEVEAETEEVETELEVEAETEEVETEVEEAETEVEADTEEIETELEAEAEIEEVETGVDTDTEEIETELEAEAETEDVETEVEEAETEVEVDTKEIETELEAETDTEEIDTEKEMEIGVNDEGGYSNRSIFSPETNRSKFDFPVFRTSLFPDYNNTREEVSNNFDEMMDEAQNKMRDNILREEEMQREAEQLLASLGISLDDIHTSENINESDIFKGMEGHFSRDELKKLIQIDEKKKEILRKLKDFR